MAAPTRNDPCGISRTSRLTPLMMQCAPRSREALSCWSLYFWGLQTSRRAVSSGSGVMVLRAQLWGQSPRAPMHTFGSHAAPAPVGHTRDLGIGSSNKRSERCYLCRNVSAPGIRYLFCDGCCSRLEPHMNTSATFPDPTGFPPRTRFILVNDCVLRTKASCTQCRKQIERGYLRALGTRLLYCDAQCFAEHENSVMPRLLCGPATRAAR
jgi:hypothetical protein